MQANITLILLRCDTWHTLLALNTCRVRTGQGLHQPGGARVLGAVDGRPLQRAGGGGLPVGRRRVPAHHRGMGDQPLAAGMPSYNLFSHYTIYSIVTILRTPQIHTCTINWTTNSNVLINRVFWVGGVAIYYIDAV